MKAGEWQRDFGALSVLGAAVAVFFWPAAALEGAFFVQDVMVQNHPFRDFFARALRAGQLPLWNAAINCGFPLFAEGQAGPLYPPNVVLALLLPTWAALNGSRQVCRRRRGEECEGLDPCWLYHISFYGHFVGCTVFPFEVSS